MIKLVRSWLRRLTRRPDKTEWAFIVALAIATRGECTRRKVGAIVLDERGRLAGAGYNGSYDGGPSCLEGACPRGQHYLPYDSPGFCACGKEWTYPEGCPDAVQSGSSYDTGPGACHAIHAELNALLDVSDRNRIEGGILYVTTKPCEGCLKIIRSIRWRLSEVAWLDEEGNVDSAVWPFGG